MEETFPLPRRQLTLLLPMYNESTREAGGNLLPGDPMRLAVPLYRDGFKEYGIDARIVAVDDASTDDSVAMARDELGLEVICLPREKKIGPRGGALKLGFLAVAGSSEVVMYTDADGSYSVATLIALYERIRSGADIAVAHRDSHESISRAWGHKVLQYIGERLVPTRVSDAQAGAKAFRGDIALDVWQKVTHSSWIADREALWHAQRAGHDIEEVSAAIEPQGDSRVHMFRDTAHMVKDCVEIRLIDTMQTAIDQEATISPIKRAAFSTALGLMQQAA